MIKRALWSACLLAVVAVGPSVSPAESTPDRLPLRVQWDVNLPRDGLQAVCGQVFNDGPVTAWNIVLRVEALDGMDWVTHSRELEVPGEVPSERYAVFCVPEPVGAPAYRVRVIGADRTPGAAE